MKINKGWRIVASTPTIILSALKNTKIDNFVGGLVFGAIFSLIVNIATVKIQEDVTRQRSLESLEREIVFHILTTQRALEIEKEVNTLPFEEINPYTLEELMQTRLDTRLWDSRGTLPYLMQLDSDQAAEVEAYYTVVVENINRDLESNNKFYDEAYRKCGLFYTILEPGEVPGDQEYCSIIAKRSAGLQALVIGRSIDPLTQLTEKFHPTEDRLKSFWLKWLLGSESVGILK